MAAGDIKDERAVVVELTAGEAIAKGQVVHLEADGYWDPAILTDTGKFAVAIEAAAGALSKFRGVIWGPVEVTATAAEIPKGAQVMAGSTGLVVLSDWGVYGETLGTTMEAFASGGVQTIWMGLVG